MEPQPDSEGGEGTKSDRRLCLAHRRSVVDGEASAASYCSSVVNRTSSIKHAGNSGKGGQNHIGGSVPLTGASRNVVERHSQHQIVPQGGLERLPMQQYLNCSQPL